MDARRRGGGCDARFQGPQAAIRLALDRQSYKASIREIEMPRSRILIIATVVSTYCLLTLLAMYIRGSLGKREVRTDRALSSGCVRLLHES